MALLTSVCEIEHTRVSESKQDGGLGWQRHLRVFAPILIVYSFLSFYRLDHQRWIPQRRETDPVDAVPELGHELGRGLDR